MRFERLLLSQLTVEPSSVEDGNSPIQCHSRTEVIQLQWSRPQLRTETDHAAKWRAEHAKSFNGAVLS